MYPRLYISLLLFISINSYAQSPKNILPQLLKGEIYDMVITAKSDVTTEPVITSQKDTSKYVLSISELKDSILIIKLKLKKYSVYTSNNFGTSYYYSTDKVNKSMQYQMAFDNLDASIRQTIDNEALLHINLNNDSLYVTGPDIFIDSLQNLPSGIKQMLRSSYSNDYFEGLFNLSFGINGKRCSYYTKNFILKDQRFSLPITSFCNITYTNIDSVCSNRTFILSGNLRYRNPSWEKYRFEKETYASGQINGKIVYKQGSYFPELLALKFNTKIPRMRDVNFDTIDNGEINITVKKR